MVRKINRLLAGTALCTALLCGAANAKEIQTNMARMQAMDKVTGKVSEIDVPVNGETVFGTFSVVVRYCATRSPEETPENFAFVDVVDNYKTENPVNIFKGWMMSSSPALNAVEHPIYDVWLLKCYDGDVSKLKLLTAEKLKNRDEMIKAQPKNDQLSAEAKKAIAEEQRAAEEAKRAAEAREAKSVSAEMDNKAADVLPHEVEKPKLPEAVALAPVEQGAPQPLIVPVVLTPEEAPESVPEREPTVTDTPQKEITNEEKPVEVDLPAQDLVAAETETVVSIPVSDENTATLSGDVETPVPETEDLLVPPTEETVLNTEQPAQLIRFEDEIEEDSFDIDAEALAN